jgi:hypothetical protein
MDAAGCMYVFLVCKEEDIPIDRSYEDKAEGAVR